MNMNFYAKLSNDRICEQIVATPKVISSADDYIEIGEYNEELLWRKWEGDQWSAKKYIPKIDPTIQDKLDTIDQLEGVVEELKEELKLKDDTIFKPQNELSVLSDTVDFLIMEGDEVND